MPPLTNACILMALRCCLLLLAPRLLFGLVALSSAALTASAVGLSMRLAVAAAALTAPAAVVAAVAAAVAVGLDTCNCCCSSARVFATGLTLLLRAATIAPAAAAAAAAAVVAAAAVGVTVVVPLTAVLLVWSASLIVSSVDGLGLNSSARDALGKPVQCGETKQQHAVVVSTLQLEVELVSSSKRNCCSCVHF
jgi:hypothetical protein